MEYRAYAITVRPADGITDEQIESVTKMVRRLSDYCVVVTEKTGFERHLHAGLFLRRPAKRGVLNVRLRELKCFNGLSNTEKYVMNQGTRIMYNMDFVNEYLTKDDNTVVYYCELPPQGGSDQYFPPPEEQAKAQKTARLNKAKSKHLQLLEELWNEHVPEGTECTVGLCRHLLFEWCFEKRLIKDWQRRSDFHHMAQKMFFYITKATKCPDWY